MRRLAIDLGMNLGYAFKRSPDELVSGGYQLKDNKKSSSEMRWVVLYRFLAQLHEDEDFEEVVYERPGNLFGHARKVLPGIQAIIELWAAQNGLAIRVCGPKTVKMFATGDGNADKDMMLVSAKLRWPGRQFETHDEVDACFLLTYFEKNHVREVGDKKLPKTRKPRNRS